MRKVTRLDAASVAALQRVEATRVAQRVCRHCGGRVPCWSDAGDWAVGLRYPMPVLKVRARGVGAKAVRRDAQ